ncbi:8-oxo-dGTP diphosphatase [Streptococcus merionis]|uniref:8-oxo-dGTP diphosphatase n=1 Tax=Streptococcus merionis TaxID=400065 RepID=UPI003518F915
MPETIKNFVNNVVKNDDKILLINRQHDAFSGWIQSGGKVEFPESFREAAVRELKEETGLTARKLQLKGISGYTNPDKRERHVYYDFLCTDFEGQLLVDAPEGEPRWFQISELDHLDMQADIRERLPLYWEEGSFERIHYWDEEGQVIARTVEYRF